MKAAHSARAIQRALRLTTERLASELAQPTRQKPSWSQFEWRIARAVAAMHGVSPLLATTLCWRGPDEWRSFLDLQRAHTRCRQQRIEQLLQTLDRRAREEDIALVPLKGAALHQLDLYESGQRPMADLDLLVARRDVPRAAHVIETLGFQSAHAYWRHRSFSPADRRTHTALGEHSDNYIKIELHEQVCERLPVRPADVSALIYPAVPTSGLHPYPTLAALLGHLLLHTAGSIVNRSVRLLQLHDIALVARRMAEQDWEDLLRLSASRQSPWWWALPPLLLTTRYYPEVVRSTVLDGLAVHCPNRLRKSMRQRQLSDVSLSFLSMEAFPGIEWTQTGRERAHYIGLRIRPNAEMLALRRSLAESEPGLAANPWTQLRQGARILRWIVRRPPRPATMYAVNAALSQ